MSSTQNINTAGNYCLETEQRIRSAQYMMYRPSQYTSDFSVQSNNAGQNAQIADSSQNWETVFKKSCNTESFLFGIGASNLEAPLPEFNHEPVRQPFAEIFDSGAILMPEPMAIEKSQRPRPT